MVVLKFTIHPTCFGSSCASLSVVLFAQLLTGIAQTASSLKAMPPKSPPFDISSAAVASAEQELREAEADRIFSSIVLTREIDWEGLEQSGVIDRKELGLALEYDKKPLQDQVNLWRDRPVDLALLLLKVLSSSGNNNQNKEAIEYVIVLIDDAIQQEPLRVLYFHEAARGRMDVSF